MKKRASEIRNRTVLSRFTEREIELMDKWAGKLEISRAEFVARAVCITMESDVSLRIAANMMVPTVKAVKAAVLMLREDNPEFAI